MDSKKEKAREFVTQAILAGSDVLLGIYVKWITGEQAENNKEAEMIEAIDAFMSDEYPINYIPELIEYIRDREILVEVSLKKFRDLGLDDDFIRRSKKFFNMIEPAKLTLVVHQDQEGAVDDQSLWVQKRRGIFFLENLRDFLENFLSDPRVESTLPKFRVVAELEY